MQDWVLEYARRATTEERMHLAYIVINHNKEKENNMYRLFINVNGQRNYVVNEKRDGNSYSFQLTTSQEAARKFKGGGIFSASKVAELFEKEAVQKLVWNVKSNGSVITSFKTEADARAALVQLSEVYNCLSVTSTWV